MLIISFISFVIVMITKQTHLNIPHEKEGGGMGIIITPM